LTVAFIGTVCGFNNGLLEVQELTTNEKYKIIPGNDLTLELEIGKTAVFMGTLNKGQLTLISYDVRKLIDPMYEEDLLNASSNISISLVNDPFPQIFNSFIEENKKYLDDYNKYLEEQQNLSNRKTKKKTKKEEKQEHIDQMQEEILAIKVELDEEEEEQEDNDE
jgi:hypothetical protein